MLNPPLCIQSHRTNMILTKLTRDSITTLIHTGVKYGNYLRENYVWHTDEEIGKGAFGKVYRVRRIEPSSDAQFSEDVALKRISLDFENDYSNGGNYTSTSTKDQSILEHFLQCCQEAVLQSETFSHPNVVHVHDKWIQPTPNMMTAEELGEDFLTIIEYLESVEGGADPTLETEVREALVRTTGWGFFRTSDKESSIQQTENEEPPPNLTRENMMGLMKIGDDGTYLEDNYTIDENGSVTVNEESRLSDLYSNPLLPIVLERIELDYENNYKSDSHNVLSSDDQIKLRKFMRYCKEAVSQPTHPVRICDNWIQKAPHLNDPEEISDRFFAIEKYFESPNYPEFQPGDGQALARIEGLSLYLTMDLYNEDLKTWLGRKERRDKTEKELNDISRIIFGNIVGGLRYIHDEMYIHVDLKPANILIKYDNDLDNCTAALSDFGLSRLATTPGEINNYRPGTDPYNSAPEEFFSYKFDMWSLGLIIYQMTTKWNVLDDDLRLLKRNAMKKENPQALQEFLQTASQSISANERLQQTFHNIITQCLQSHETRCSASDFDENDPW